MQNVIHGLKAYISLFLYLAQNVLVNRNQYIHISYNPFSWEISNYLECTVEFNVKGGNSLNDTKIQ